ncbi:mannosylglycerate hydrolase [Marchantia polymorpha subsp. ruderalis]|uniref:Mannosylglycerate hydrolase MGH1-like glycoside hydrolase domain-containing protein n=2 Tax=Marchantia polymorpha TaxID=3197 RepID=A0AAF6BUM2_MARPO|nr:hypothetical protein MARPO_0046s0111 [Marchantia polymorpha]BBN15706.1 hypothetical protein Mp_7g00130 [Marchantia polymorpha subsp. ruderalis]|eukprot:PTQ39301.1 hypothetical protein MARPO_0046s0111 [Marchantia polymorpha]
MAGNDAPSSGGLVGPIPTTVSLASCPALEAKSILPPVRVFRSTSVENLNSTPKDRAYWRAKSLRRLFSMREPEEDLEGSARLPIVEESIECLRRNDYGGYTIPAHNLYPFQWNWDSAIVAAGWAVFDEARAWEEFEKLFSGQWEDGMVPSIIFHRPSTSYFPGPEIWGSPAAPSESTGITQPPVASVSARFLFEHTEHAELAEEQMADLFPKLLASHRWWYKARDPEKKGIVAILHPWESGMDNSPAWDAALQFPVDNLPPYERKDLQHVNACMRPTKETYDHYLTLLYRFKAENYYDSNKLYWVSPFRMTDLCTNSILFRANRDLRWLAIKLGKTDVVAEIDEWLERGFEGFKQLWDEDAGLFKCQDQLTGKLDDAATSAAFLPLFAGVASKEQAAKLAENLKQWLDKVPFGVPSTDPRDPRFEPLRYWRGPVWIIINWMIFNGLRHYGYDDLAQRIYDDSVALTSNAGLREYFDPQTGDGAGGELFSWTAAMCLAWLDRPSAIAIGHKMSGPKIHLDQEVSPPK